MNTSGVRVGGCGLEGIARQGVAGDLRQQTVGAHDPALVHRRQRDERRPCLSGAGAGEKQGGARGDGEELLHGSLQVLQHTPMVHCIRKHSEHECFLTQ